MIDILLIFAKEKFEKIFIFTVSYHWTSQRKPTILKIDDVAYSNSMKICSMCVIRQGFFNISKVNMKKESCSMLCWWKMADKSRLARLSLEENKHLSEVVWEFPCEQEGVQGQKWSGKCLEASSRKAWIFK